MGLSLTPVTHVSASPLFDPGRSVFPSPVLTLAYFLGRLPIASEAQVLTHIHPTPNGLLPNPSQYKYSGPPCPGLVRQPSAQSPFAHDRRYLSWRGVSRHVRGHYPSFFALTNSSANPNPSPCLWVSPRSVGLCRLLSAPAGNRTFPTLSLRFFPYVPGPLPRLLLECIYPFLPPKHWPSPR